MSTPERARRGQGASNSPFFTKLNYDIRCTIYSYLTPIFNPDDAWKGFAISCTSAYEELTAPAPIQVRNFIQETLDHCERDTGYKLKLYREIDPKGDIAQLRSIIIDVPREALENPTQQWYYDFAVRRASPPHDGKIHPLYNDRFVEDAVIISMHPLLSMFFTKITMFFSTEGMTAGPYEKHARAAHAAVTVNVLFERMREDNTDTLPNTPSARLASLECLPMNTKSIGVAWGSRCEKTSFTGIGQYLHSNGKQCTGFWDGSPRCVFYDVKTGISPDHGEIGYIHDGSWQMESKDAASSLWFDANCPYHIDLYVRRSALGQLVVHDNSLCRMGEGREFLVHRRL